MPINNVMFLSNFFTHHQKPFSDAMFDRLGAGYHFVETCSMTQERKNMGWEIRELPPYVVDYITFGQNQKMIQEMIEGADVVIIGSAPPMLVKKRIAEDKLVFRYSERPLKKGMELWRYPDRLIRWHHHYPQKKNVFLLCSSAYAAADYAKFFMFKNRSFKWGYFPPTKRYLDIEGLIKGKAENSLIWVARFIDLKHPEIAVEVCRRLNQEGYSFTLNMIGNGPLFENTAKEIKQNGLENCVHLLGAMTPEQVRQHMEKAQIQLFTSDKNEGWGAVLNEAMNSACVPVANKDIGSVPYLIDSGKNGYIYSTVDELYERVKFLLNNKEMWTQMAKNAYITIADEWNAEIAADKFLALSNELSRNVSVPVFKTGICSRADL